MRREAQFVVGAMAGGLTSVLWLATEGIFPWEARLPLLWLPVVLLVGFLTLGGLRKQFAALRAAFGYLLGVSPAVALHLLVVVAFGALWGWESLYTFSERLQSRPFEATVWRQLPNDRTRARMSEDLIQSHKLVGLTLLEAQALLGPPSGNPGGRTAISRIGLELIASGSAYLLEKGISERFGSESEMTDLPQIGGDPQWPFRGRDATSESTCRRTNGCS